MRKPIAVLVVAIVSTLVLPLTAAGQVDHTGNTTSSVNQSGTSAVGGSLAGSQGLLIVGGANTSVTALNRGIGTTANAGDATTSNAVGSSLTGDVAPGGTVNHTGDSVADLTQRGTATVGRAAASDQSIAAIGTTGDASVSATNRAIGPTANGGNGTVLNTIGTAAAGDSAAVFAPDAFADGSADTSVAADGGGDDTATALPATASDARADASAVGGSVDHAGDSNLTIDQNAVIALGPAGAGVQDVVAEAGDDATIGARNRVLGGRARGGDATGLNVIGVATAGDDASAVAGNADALSSADASASATGGGNDSATAGDATAGRALADASATGGSVDHTGDSLLDIGQRVDASAGDVASGFQTVVGDAGDALDLEARNRAVDVRSVGGSAIAANAVGIARGGDTAEAIAGSAVADASADASADAQGPGDDTATGAAATGGVARALAVATAGTVNHTGDSGVVFRQRGDASVGDAASASQLAGAFAGGDADVLLRNRGTDARARTGDATMSNTVDTVLAGDSVTAVGGFALADASADSSASAPGGGTDFAFGGNATGGTAVARADATGGSLTHTGASDLDGVQRGTATVASGVAGSQLLSGDVGGDLVLDARNRAIDVRATTGDAVGSNFVGDAVSGGDASAHPGSPDADASADASAVGDLAVPGIATPGSETTSAAAAPGSLIAVGDITGDLTQSGATGVGDAVAGSQVDPLPPFVVGGSTSGPGLVNTAILAVANGGSSAPFNTILSLVVGGVVLIP